MRRAAVMVLLCLVACTRSVQVKTAPGAPPTFKGASAVPAGTLFAAQVHQPLSTQSARPGDLFTAELLDRLVAEDGTVVAEPGALIRGVVRRAKPSGRTGDPAVLELELATIESDGDVELPLGAEVAMAPATQSGGGAATLLGALVGLAAGIAVGAVAGDDAGWGAVGGAGGLALGAALGAGLARRDATVQQGAVVTLRLVQPLAAPGGARPATGRERPAR